MKYYSFEEIDELGETLVKKYIKDKNLNNEKIDEIIIPKCIIEKNPQETLNFFKNVINTYKKFKLRTNNFINKRVFPCLLLLEEKYTDFLTALINEYDYFTKLNFANMKKDNEEVYSLKKFKYDMNLLKKNGIKNKYDLFGFYLSNIFMKKIILPIIMINIIIIIIITIITINIIIILYVVITLVL